MFKWSKHLQQTNSHKEEEIEKMSRPYNFSVLRMLKSNKYLMQYFARAGLKLRKNDVNVMEPSHWFWNYENKSGIFCSCASQNQENLCAITFFILADVQMKTKWSDMLLMRGNKLPRDDMKFQSANLPILKWRKIFSATFCS